MPLVSLAASWRWSTIRCSSSLATWFQLSRLRSARSFSFRLRSGRNRVAFALLVGASLLSAANYGGRFYAPEYGRFSIVERSHAYRDFHAVQVEAIRLLVRKPVGIPAFVGKEVDYMTSTDDGIRRETDRKHPPDLPDATPTTHPRPVFLTSSFCSELTALTEEQRWIGWSRPPGPGAPTTSGQK